MVVTAASAVSTCSTLSAIGTGVSSSSKSGSIRASSKAVSNAERESPFSMAPTVAARSDAPLTEFCFQISLNPMIVSIHSCGVPSSNVLMYFL
jgi:hypothetical protein